MFTQLCFPTLKEAVLSPCLVNVMLICCCVSSCQPSNPSQDAIIQMTREKYIQIDHENAGRLYISEPPEFNETTTAAPCENMCDHKKVALICVHNILNESRNHKFCNYNYFQLQWLNNRTTLLSFHLSIKHCSNLQYTKSVITKF